MNQVEEIPANEGVPRETATNGDAMVVIEGVTKSFDGKQVLQGVEEEGLENGPLLYAPDIEDGAPVPLGQGAAVRSFPSHIRIEELLGELGCREI